MAGTIGPTGAMVALVDTVVGATAIKHKHENPAGNAHLGNSVVLE
jgi:hypothetical protein